MISEKIQAALNTQINVEQYSAQLYLAMSAHCDGLGFKGFAHWLRVQAGEETSHAVKLIDFLLDRRGRLELQPIAVPPREFGTVIDVFQQSLDHEEGNTRKINALFELARTEKDYASEIQLQWYVTEQVEEEANFGQVLDHMKSVGLQGGGIWYLDSRMAKREAK
jgi:ferritin